MLFSEIAGQEEVKRKLVQTVRSSRVSHAQLFFGPQGSRKLALAIAYAQFINCRNRQHMDETSPFSADSCGTCPSCIKYAKLIHPDLHFIFPVAKTKEVDKNPMSRDFMHTWRETLLNNDFRLSPDDWYEAIGIEKKQGIINADDCNEILKTLSYKSYESEYKVMIIWMAEKIFHSAAPKILKILEEPPDKTLFILITENQEQIINTILSRTQLVSIPKLTDDVIGKMLTGKFSCSVTEAKRIALLVDGNYTEAVKILHNDEDERYNPENFIRWMRLCLVGKVAGINDFVGEIAKTHREKQKGFLLYTSRMIRNSLLMNYGNSQWARMNDEEKDFLMKFARFITNEYVLQIAAELDKAQYHIERNANPNIVFMDLSLMFSKILKITTDKK
jgi:DNA polymerase-3 subunit delta'